jgi:hypothetical protein
LNLLQEQHSGSTLAGRSHSIFCFRTWAHPGRHVTAEMAGCKLSQDSTQRSPAPHLALNAFLGLTLKQTPDSSVASDCSLLETPASGCWEDPPGCCSAGGPEELRTARPLLLGDVPSQLRKTLRTCLGVFKLQHRPATGVNTFLWRQPAVQPGQLQCSVRAKVATTAALKHVARCWNVQRWPGFSACRKADL